MFEVSLSWTLDVLSLSARRQLQERFSTSGFVVADGKLQHSWTAARPEDLQTAVAAVTQASAAIAAQGLPRPTLSVRAPLEKSLSSDQELAVVERAAPALTLLMGSAAPVDISLKQGIELTITGAIDAAVTPAAIGIVTALAIDAADTNAVHRFWIALQFGLRKDHTDPHVFYPISARVSGIGIAFQSVWGGPSRSSRFSASRSIVSCTAYGGFDKTKVVFDAVRPWHGNVKPAGRHSSVSDARYYLLDRGRYSVCSCFVQA